MSITYDSMTESQKEFTFYFISVCEAGGGEPDWAAQNSASVQNGWDYWTIGILQWMGSAGARLLQYMKTNYHTLFYDMPTSWISDLETYGSDSSIWQERSFPDDDALKWRAAIYTHLDDAKAAQVGYWLSGEQGETLAGYMQLGRNATDASSFSYYGMEFTDIKKLIYYLGIWHVGPAYAVNVWNLLGPDPDWETLCATTLSVLSTSKSWSGNQNGWTTRYKYGGVAYTLLNDWDGESDPPEDYGDISAAPIGGQLTTGGTALSGINSGADRIEYIYTNGQELLVVTAKDEHIRCIPAMGNNVWIPSTNTANNSAGAAGGAGGSSYGSDNYKVPTSGWKYAQQAYDMLNQVMGSWTYDQDFHSSDPWSNGGITDCSGMVWWTMYHVEPELANHYRQDGGAPGYTGTFHGNSAPALQSGTNGQQPDQSQILPGDLIICNYSAPYYTTEGGKSGMHVVMCFGNDVIVHCPGTPQPVRDSVTNLCNSVLWWEHVRPPYTPTDTTETTS